MSPFGEQMGPTFGSNRMTPQFFGTEFEKIKSSNSLSKVVENLELVNKWGVDKETAIRTLKGIVNTRPKSISPVMRISALFGSLSLVLNLAMLVGMLKMSAGSRSPGSAVSHGSSTARFDGVNVINTARKI